MRNLTLFLVALGFVGCNDYELVDANDINTGIDDETLPDIVVDPASIDFGSLQSGLQETKTVEVTISNQGNGDLHLGGIELDDAEQPFDLGAVGAVLVPPGGATTFTVTFAPETASSSSATVLINSDDPDTPVAPVALTGNGIAPIISLDPKEYDFGTVYIGCEPSQAITISNIGNADLIVSDFALNTGSSDLSFDDNEATNGELPWTIAPGNSVEVWVDYAPLDDYTDVGYLMVESNDPYSPTAMATQTGIGELAGENTDLFEQPLRGMSDILFVIDNSCSMADEQANLAANFAVFATTLSALDVDYQVSVITTDSAEFLHCGGSEEIINSDISDVEGELIAQTNCGTSGSGNEMPMEFMYQATQPGADAGPGGDFLRDDALLAFIVVSDEPDSSPSSWSTYLSYFQGLKDDSDDVVVHAISGDYPSGCGGASYTNGVYEMSVATSGQYLSVCATDWASHLETLVVGSTKDLSSFELTDYPVPSSIEVTVDGIRATTGWSYNSVDNSIDFEDNYVPEGGSTIQVDYALFGDCDG